MDPDQIETVDSTQPEIQDVPNPNGNSSQTLFPESPVYEPEDMDYTEEKDVIDLVSGDNESKKPFDLSEDLQTLQMKRKFHEKMEESSPKIPRIDLDDDYNVTTQDLDKEVSILNEKQILENPSTSRSRTPAKTTPKKLTKRSNSSDINNIKTPKTLKVRPASVDITKERKTPRKINLDSFKQKPIVTVEDKIVSDSPSSRPSVEFVKEIQPSSSAPETIEEERYELDDSQNIHLVLSPTPEDLITEERLVTNHLSDIVVPKDRQEILDPGKILRPHSEGYNYSDLSSNLSQPKPNPICSKGKTTDLDSTDSLCSLSPDHVPSVASKLISKLDPDKIQKAYSEGYKCSDVSSNLSQLKPKPDCSKGKISDLDSTDSICSLSPDHIPSVASKLISKMDPGKLHKPRSEGYNYSDVSSNLSQPKPKPDCKGKTTDLDSTDSVCSLSPDHIPTVASKLISKLSNGNSSTPTDESIENNHRSQGSNLTPDMSKLVRGKLQKGKNESFRTSNNTTPSTISPLPNGHSLPIATPQVPIFDIHVCNNEDGEFLSLYIVKTDNDLGMDMCKEYQRFSKRFTIDPYLGDVSVSNSTSSVTSGGMINLPNRTSFASTVTSTSTSSSNRTSDGAFVVPQAPRKSISNPSTSIKGYNALMLKLQDIFSHFKDYSIDEENKSSCEDKVSVGVQCLSLSDSNNLSNGNASPEEVSKCDKATPKSSLKKTKTRGRRPLAGKTKRAILPTQTEEPEFLHGMNSPEMIPMNGDGDKAVTSPKHEKPSTVVGTPKSVAKLKQKKGPTSPRPATPVEKLAVKQEYPGYPPDTVVLAKWVDKRYYSGKVLEITEPNKYLIKFDDGQSKVLLDDFIIFGDMKQLPLQAQPVYAMVDEEQTYEPGLVLSIEENDSGTITYRCTTDGDTVVMVTASELYLTEEQARCVKESARSHSPTAPSTPRRRHHRELDLDNIIHGPRSARSREKGNSSARKRVISPKSPKASTSGLKSKQTPSTPTPLGRKRVASESSELSENSNHAPPVRLEEVPGVEPEVQRTPRKIDGVKAGPLQLKGAAKQTIGKKNSKLAKFENDADTITRFGPIPSGENKLFSGVHFLLTCTEAPRRASFEKSQETRHYSSEEDSEANQPTDTEDLEFTDRPFNKERLKEQIEAAGGIVHSHFDDLPKTKYSATKLIAPRPCLTAKYIQCLAANIQAVSHAWVIMSCIQGRLLDVNAYVLPAGWSILKGRYINWAPSSGKRNQLFKDKTILLCGDQDTFIKFWERVCTLVGANTRVVNEEDLNMSGAMALVTDWDCPHEVQNKANQDNIPLVSTAWVVQCLIEASVLTPTSHVKFSFMYTEPE